MIPPLFENLYTHHICTIYTSFTQYRSSSMFLHKFNRSRDRKHVIQEKTCFHYDCVMQSSDEKDMMVHVLENFHIKIYTTMMVLLHSYAKHIRFSTIYAMIHVKFQKHYICTLTKLCSDLYNLWPLTKHCVPPSDFIPQGCILIKFS